MRRNSEVLLAVDYFTKELPGLEAETKMELLTLDPVSFILDLTEEFESGAYFPLLRQHTLGTLPTGIKSFSYEITYYGSSEEEGLKETFGLVKHPTRDFYLLKKKGSESEEDCGMVLIRKEEKDDLSTPLTSKEADLLISSGPFIRVGSLERERYGFYAFNSESWRNFGIVADRVTSGENQIAQVEIEYKGRAGVFPVLPCTRIEIVKELEEIALAVQQKHKNILRPTRLTKFGWLLSLQEER